LGHDIYGTAYELHYMDRLWEMAQNVNAQNVIYLTDLESTTGPYPGPYEFRPRSYFLFLYDEFEYYIPTFVYVCQTVSSSQVL
jgi:hypothetical protein